jgi:MFS family permease
MGVASLSATDRFQVSAAALSTLTVAQLLVYAVMHVPAGILLDRFGPRRLIIAGSLITGMGNLIVAVSPLFPVAVIGRAIVGFGDAFVFISMIRLINSWIPGSRATRYTQLFANLGQLGQLGSAIPFAWLLGFAGWAPAFGSISALALVAASVATLFIRDDPKQQPMTMIPGPMLAESFRLNWRDANTWKAFWVHFTLQSSGSLFILLWGYPFLVQGELVDKGVATALLSSFVFIGFFVGPILSHICVTHPQRRHVLVTSIYAAMVFAWLLIFLTPGRNPLWQLVLLVLIIGVGGPASMIAFDYSRTTISESRIGSANGIINSGGFVATFSSMFLIGMCLDLIRDLGLVDNRQLYNLDAFKLALPLQLFIMSLGLFFFYRSRRAAIVAGIGK